MPEYNIIMADMGLYPQVFVTDSEGALVFSSSYEYDEAAYINAGVDLARMARDENWFRVRDCDDELDPELYEYARENCARLGGVVDGVASVMTPSDIVDYGGDHGMYWFAMAYHMELYRDTFDWGPDETPMRDFCRDFLAYPASYTDR